MGNRCSHAPLGKVDFRPGGPRTARRGSKAMDTVQSVPVCQHSVQERRRVMLRLLSATPILWICVTSCPAAQVTSQPRQASAACHTYDVPAKNVLIKGLRLYPGLEGSYGEDLRCPGRALDVRFSKSDLYTGRYKDLLSFIMGGNSSG